MTDLRHLLTERLDLRRPEPDADLAELFPIFTDPDGWWYDPAARHDDPACTRRWLALAAERFDAHGLSYWTIRTRSDGAVIGAGGVQRQRTRAWNLSYRLAAGAQGRGFATELCHAGLAAAAQVDPTVPVIAWVAAHNRPSRRVAERAGLVDRGVFADPSDGEPRHAYADRRIDEYERLTR